jgi:CHAT domain-containing protein
VAVLADPVFDAGDSRVNRTGRGSGATGKASTKARRTAAGGSTQDTGSAAALERSLVDVGAGSGGVLERLVLTRREANAIAHGLPPGQTLEALDFRASRETATSAELARYRVVHFATHALIDSHNPALSGLVLSLVDEHGQPRDGFLRLQDIYNLTLPADLIVMSACQTALGPQIRGEGLIGLTRGFMYAGAPRVVASLWRVDDAATAELMAGFYRNMFARGLRPAAALRAAQLDMSRTARWRDPYYWAAFQLQGEWR